MRKHIFVLSILICAFGALNAQNKIDTIPAKFKGNNEIKLNALYLLNGVVNFSYERIVAKNFTIGLTASLNLIATKSYYRSEYNPYLRVYFGNQRANAFFLEGNFLMVNREDNSEGLTQTVKLPNGGEQTTSVNTGVRNSYGIAGGLGYKHVLKKGYLIEVNGVIGKLMGDFDGKRPQSTGWFAGIDKIYARGAISIGKRF